MPQLNGSVSLRRNRTLYRRTRLVGRVWSATLSEIHWQRVRALVSRSNRGNSDHRHDENVRQPRRQQ